MSDIERLRKKRDHYYQELEELHIYEPSQEWYLMRRHEIESQIAFIEDAIDELEKDLERDTLSHAQVVIYSVTIIVAVAALIILLWS